jgi:hypothetical protein
MLIEQFRHLGATAGRNDLAEAADGLAEYAAAASADDKRVLFEGEALRRFSGVLLTLVHRADDATASMAPGVSRLRAGIDWSDARTRLAPSGPGIAVVDDLLSPAALAAIQRHLTDSTIWFDDRFEAGYVAATLEDGLACHGLLSAAAEIHRHLGPLAAGSPLMTAWAFRYGRSAKGVGAHADFSRFSVNIWLTPDAANLAPGTGGLRFWNVQAEPGTGFEQYNASQDWIDGMLARATQDEVVPYRCNRAVIFRSAILHASEPIHFRPEFVHQRINLTLGYGYR